MKQDCELTGDCSIIGERTLLMETAVQRALAGRCQTAYGGRFTGVLSHWQDAYIGGICLTAETYL